MKKIILLLMSFFGGLFFALPVFAYTETQGDYSTIIATTTVGSSVTPDNPGIPWVAPRNGDLTRICLWVAQTEGVSYTPTIEFYDGSWTGSTLISWSNPGALCRSFSGVTVSVGELYYIDIGHPVGRKYSIYGNNDDYFYHVIDITLSSDNEISFTTTTVSTADFLNWSVNFSLFATTTDYYKVGVAYGFSSGNYSYNDYQNLINFGETTGSNIGKILAGNSVIIDDTVGFKIPKNNRLLPEQLFYARAYLYKENADYSLTVLASSTEWEFITNNGTLLIQQGQTFIVPTTTPRLCDPNAGFWEGLICPSGDLLDRFSQLKEMVQNKPPFGYVSAITDSFSDNVTSTTSTVDTSDLSGLSDLTILQNIRTIMTWGLYLMFGLWLFNRLRSFEV